MSKSFVIAAVLLTTSIARAGSNDPLDQPSPGAVAASSAVPAAAASGYIGGGVLLGKAGDLFVHGFALDLGTRITSHLWVHGLVAAGTASQERETSYGGAMLGPQGDSQFMSMRAGLELRGCGSATACSYIGADLGFENAAFTPTSWGGGTPVTGSDVAMYSEDISTAVVVPRVGLELGSRIKVRPALEVPVTSSGSVGFNATFSVGTGW